MEINEFKELLKDKPRKYYSQNYCKNLKIKTDKKHLDWVLSKTTTCNKCNHEKTKILYVTFKQPQEHLTIFEAGLLWSLFVDKRRMIDYANYHKCIAGKRFIKNIKKVSEVNKNARYTCVS